MSEQPKIISRAEAKALGLKRYFTGKPCKHGHVAERTVCGRLCVSCHRIHINRYREANLEKVRNAVRLYDAAHPEKKRERYRRWRAKHLETVRRNRQIWEDNNRERKRELGRRSYERCRQKVLERQHIYRRENREKIAKYGRIYKAPRRALIVNLLREWGIPVPEGTLTAHLRQVAKEIAWDNWGIDLNAYLTQLIEETKDEHAGRNTSSARKKRGDKAVIPHG